MIHLLSRKGAKQPEQPPQEKVQHGHVQWRKETAEAPDAPNQASVNEEQPKKKGNSWAATLRDLLSGEFLIREGALAQAPYLIFVSFLLVLYVSLGYYYEHLERERQTTERRLEELRAEFKTLQAEFETQLQQSQVERNMAAIGLTQPVDPPFLIEVEPLKNRGK